MSVAKPKFKKGDKVRCKPGFEVGRDDHSDGGGSGYQEGKVLVIDHTSPGSSVLPEKGLVYWARSGNGIYEIALELAESVVQNQYEVF